MKLRTYLIISYLALIILLTVGMLTIEDLIIDKVTTHTTAMAEEGVHKIIDAHFEVAAQVMTKYGENYVEVGAEDLAKEMSLRLGGKKKYDYPQMRRDQRLREFATQAVQTPDGVAGYVDLIDNTGVAVLHPNPEVEGKNFAIWKDKFPEMWNLVSRSFTERKVKGYYTFLDQQNRPRQKFMALVQVPRTPFIVVAVVNIDAFFRPMEANVREGEAEIIQQAREAVQKSVAELDRQLDLLVILGGIALAVGGGGAGLWFASRIARPMIKLRDGVRQIGEGNFTVAVPAKGVQEVAELARSFNALGEQLTDYIEKRDFIRDTFGRYVTQEVVKRLLESKEALEMGGETREVTIIMSDIRGFTALTADMAPEQVIIFLNRYLGKMIEILLDYRAVIDEIVGDGIIAFFGAPEPMEDHSLRAVACALSMQAAIDEINFLNEAEGLPHIEMGIGVNTGAVVVGNIGSEKRTKYSVVGAHVNFTSRIEAFALGGQVLVSASTYSQVQEAVEIWDTLKAQMKGVPGTVTLYEVGAIGGPYNIQLKKRIETLTLLKERLPVRLQRISEKIVIGATADSWITQLCETSALVTFAGDLEEWEDVRLFLLDETGADRHGKIYGKVTQVKPAGDQRREAQIRFTSVSPEIYQVIRRAMGQG